MTRPVTVISPLHAPGNPYVGAAYDSLCAQSFREWTWLILENHGGIAPPHLRDDPRVHVLQAPGDSPHGIGALKGALCEAVESPFVVELDADDLLEPRALELVLAAFERDGADFVFSDFAEFRDDGGGRWTPNTYNPAFGWESYPVTFQGHELRAMRAPEASEHNVRRVEWAPNHVRAWRLETYRRVGGHDRAFDVGDDHDLMTRMLLEGGRFVHVPECLYFYRVHAQNTVATKNAAIGAATERIYNARIWALGEHFARRLDLARVDLCGAHDPPLGYHVLDRHVPPGVSGIACDLEQAWPLETSSVGVLRAHDALEHLADPVHAMNEAHRVLAPGGFLMVSVPSTNGLGAFCDPTHRSFWNHLSFRYYTDPGFARYVPAFRGRFQVARVIEWFPSDWHLRENVPYVEAHLFALKDGGAKIMGANLWR